MITGLPTVVDRRFFVASTLQLVTVFLALFDRHLLPTLVNGQAQPLQPHAQEQPPQVQPTAPWYETLPAVAMDYKVIIDPGKEDCYFQFVNPGATFYASAQVLLPSDLVVDNGQPYLLTK